MTKETRTRITQLRTVGIPVTDQSRALDFYAGTLGLEKRLDVPFGAGKRWIEVAPPEATTTIALVAETANQPTGHDTGIRLATADADAKHADLLARGVDADPEVLRWPGVPAMFAFRDPDGNTLEIVEES
jgi:catechol 2,3-dioxygenase-like lactoylglutathione lyase family enzyme